MIEFKIIYSHQENWKNINREFFQWVHNSIKEYSLNILEHLKVFLSQQSVYFPALTPVFHVMYQKNYFRKKNSESSLRSIFSSLMFRYFSPRSPTRIFHLFSTDILTRRLSIIVSQSIVLLLWCARYLTLRGWARDEENDVSTSLLFSNRRASQHLDKCDG